MSPSPIRIACKILQRNIRVGAWQHGRRPGARSLAAALLLLLLAAAVAGAASFAALSWNNAAGGVASTATNWTPNQVPTSADDLTFNIVGTYPVTFNASTTASRTHTYRRGTVTLTASSPHTVSDGITIGAVTGNIATATLTTGTLTSNAAVVVGEGSGSIGTLNVDDDDADLITTTSAGDLIVGGNGSGTMNVTGGGLVQVADRFIAGNNSTAASTVTVSGKLLISPFTRSTLDVGGTSLAHAIGAGGDATMDVTNGARADFAGGVNVAQGSASTSTLTIAGTVLASTSFTTGGDLNIGRNTTSGSAGGVGVVNVDSYGNLDVAGTLNVAGDPDGGTGTLHLSSFGGIDAASFDVGAGGSLDFDGGTLDVSGGTFTVTNPSANLVLGGAGNPVVTLRDGCAGTLQNNVSTRAFTVGGGAGATDAIADFDVRSGSSLTITSGDGILGDTTDDGGMVVSDAGTTMTMPSASTLFVGLNGAGRFAVESGANVALGKVNVAKNPASQGDLIIGGAGTTVTMTNVAVGGSETAAGGTAAFSVSDGATCAVGSSGPLGELLVYETGTLDVANATLEAEEVEVRANVGFGENALLQNATVRAGMFRVVNANVRASGTIEGFVYIPGDVSAITAFGGDLVLGSPDVGHGFENLGVLDCGDNVVTVIDFNETILGRVKLSGGELNVVSPVPGRFQSTDSLVGFGGVDGDITNEGRIFASGPGLTFRGIVNGGGWAFSGTAVAFEAGGGFVGAGSIDAPITADSASSITATGPLELGVLNGEIAFETDGLLDVGAHDVTIVSAIAARLGRSTTLAGGSLTYGPFMASALNLNGGDSLSGFGAVNSRMSTASGSVITATGPLTIGSPLNASQIFGEMHVGPHTLTLVGGAEPSIGSLTTIGGGTFASDAALQLSSGRALRGHGTISAPSFQNAGTIEVGSPIGTLALTGNFTNTGTIKVQVGGGGSVASAAGGAVDAEAASKSAVVVADQLNVVGTAVLSGTLRVGQLAGLSVTAGQRIPIMTCGSRSGVFSSIVFDDPYLDNVFNVEYTPFLVELVVMAATGVDLPPVGNPGDGAPGDGGVSGAAIPESFALRLASRNPFTPDAGVAFEFDVPRGGAPVGVSVFDASGRRVAELVNGSRAAGTHAERWTSADLHGLSSGVYFLRMDAGAFGATKRLVMLR